MAGRDLIWTDKRCTHPASSDACTWCEDVMKLVACSGNLLFPCMMLVVVPYFGDWRTHLGMHSVHVALATWEADAIYGCFILFYGSTADEIDSVGVSLGVDFQPVGNLWLCLKNNQDNKNPLSHQRPASLSIQRTTHWYLSLNSSCFLSLTLELLKFCKQVVGSVSLLHVFLTDTDVDRYISALSTCWIHQKCPRLNVLFQACKWLFLWFSYMSSCPHSICSLLQQLHVRDVCSNSLMMCKAFKVMSWYIWNVWTCRMSYIGIL